MAIRFRRRDFLQPFTLLRYRSIFERAQWWSPQRVRAYQRKRLRALLQHAASSVPDYRDLFRRAGLNSEDVEDIEDLASLPLLSKDDIRARAPDLTAANASRFRPTCVTTTGSTKRPVTVLVDRQTHALEFAFYWRHWGWFGYRLGDRFAQLSWAEFANGRGDTLSYAERDTGRLLLNALSLSEERARHFASAMQAHGLRFLKGHASALLHFSLFVRSARLEIPRLRAVFSTGEVLEPAMRSVIVDVLGAPVADTYGQMERVVAACECPRGRMHINPDYGWWEFVDPRIDPDSGSRVGRIVGTGLHNRSMPLIRYDTGDNADIGDPSGRCPCGRGFPTIGRIHGRSVDGIVTPEGRVVTVASIAFNRATAIVQGQLVQHDLNRILVRVLPAPEFGPDDERRLVAEVRQLVGPSMNIEIDRVERPDDFAAIGQKHRPVVSTVYQRSVAEGKPLP